MSEDLEALAASAEEIGPEHVQQFLRRVAGRDADGNDAFDSMSRGAGVSGVDLGKLNKTFAVLDGKRYDISKHRMIRRAAIANTEGGKIIEQWLEGQEWVRFEGPPRPMQIDYDQEGNEIIMDEPYWAYPDALVWTRLPELP